MIRTYYQQFSIPSANAKVPLTVAIPSDMQQLKGILISATDLVAQTASTLFNLKANGNILEGDNCPASLYYPRFEGETAFRKAPIMPTGKVNSFQLEYQDGGTAAAYPYTVTVGLNYDDTTA